MCGCDDCPSCNIYFHTDRIRAIDDARFTETNEETMTDEAETMRVSPRNIGEILGGLLQARVSSWHASSEVARLEREMKDALTDAGINGDNVGTASTFAYSEADKKWNTTRYLIGIYDGILSVKEIKDLDKLP